MISRELERLSVIEFQQHIASLVAPLIVQSGAVLEGEFTFRRSKTKSPIKIECDRIVENPEIFNQICNFFEAYIRIFKKDADVFVGVVRGGKPFAEELARRLGKRWATRAAVAQDMDQEENVIESDQTAMIIEDVITFGVSADNCASRVTASGARVIGVLAVFSYGFENRDFRQWLTDYWHLRSELQKDPNLSDFLRKVEKWYAEKFKDR